MIDILHQSPSQLVADASPNAAEDQDRPTSPWTPSYSVTTQGCAMQDSADLDRLEQLPPRTMETMEEPAISYGEGTIAPHSLPPLREVAPNQNSNQTFDTSQDVLLHEPRVSEYSQLEVRVHIFILIIYQHSYAHQYLLGGKVGA